MSKIRNLDELRDIVLDTVQKMVKGKIDVTEAGVLAKLSETVISGLKTQMEYARLINQNPSIPFIAGCHKSIEHSPTKGRKLLNKPK
jgi:hypothetical protein